MQDTSHGSARPRGAPVVAHRERRLAGPEKVDRGYRGTSKTRPRRGTARTRSCRQRQASQTSSAATQHFLHQLSHEVAGRTPTAIHLELDDDTYAGVPCWLSGEQRWARVAVPIAYLSHYDTKVRPAMPSNPISLRALVRVAEARARYADWTTGRNSRPTNARLARDTGLSVRTVQRADTTLRLLGLATEVLRGRQRTRAERFASWRVGDRHRGWASVWALHHAPVLPLSPHPRKGSLLSSYLLISSKKVVSSCAGGHTAHTRRGAPRPTSTKEIRRRRPEIAPTPREAYLLACDWLRDERTPRWARQPLPQGMGKDSGRAGGSPLDSRRSQPAARRLARHRRALDARETVQAHRIGPLNHRLAPGAQRTRRPTRGRRNRTPSRRARPPDSCTRSV